MLSRSKLDQDDTARALKSIERSARLQAKLIDDLLDISHIIGGSSELDIRPVELGSVVSVAIQAIAPSAAAKQIDLNTSIQEGRTAIAGDATRMEQLISNLLSNAVKFTPAGGHIQVGLNRIDGLAELTITDNGEGIDPEFLPYVFDRFRQADSSYTRRHGGLGIGLSIVRQLVESHHGTVSASSAGVGRGATFTVRLPLIGIAATDSPSDPVQQSPFPLLPAESPIPSARSI